MSSPHRQNYRTGFTLLELVLAAGISALVMAGLTSAILIIYQVQNSSGQQISVAELGRNVLRQLERDLQSIPGTMPADVASDETATDTSETLQAASEEAAEFTTSTEEEMSAYEFWFYGDSTSVEFLAEPVRRTGRSMTQITDPEAVSAEQQLRRRLVRWGVSDYQALGLTAPDNPVEPLIRAEGFTDAWISETTWLEALPVPELVSLEFTYFDGESWLDQWDSETLGGLPKAVEVLITLQPFIASKDAQSNENTTNRWSMKRVISLPTQRFRTLSVEE